MLKHYFSMFASLSLHKVFNQMLIQFNSEFINRQACVVKVRHEHEKRI